MKQKNETIQKTIESKNDPELALLSENKTVPRQKR